VAFVALMPAWTWFVSEWSHVSMLSTEETFLAGIILPATVAMFIASWVQS
jgi:hypothetical protein